MTQQTQLTANIYAVVVPEGAAGIDINQYGGGSELNYWLIEEGKQNLIVIDLPPGSWQIIGMASSVTWTQAAGIVEHYRGGFVNYNTGSIPKVAAYSTPFLSLNSLLTSKNLDWKTTLLIRKVTE